MVGRGEGHPGCGGAITALSRQNLTGPRQASTSHGVSSEDTASIELVLRKANPCAFSASQSGWMEQLWQEIVVGGNPEGLLSPGRN